jgi:hypothetical protein
LTVPVARERSVRIDVVTLFPEMVPTVGSRHWAALERGLADRPLEPAGLHHRQLPNDR